jgi:hypothetical protein
LVTEVFDVRATVAAGATLVTSECDFFSEDGGGRGGEHNTNNNLEGLMISTEFHARQ